ncbi:MAG: type VI secretion system tube protein Hcp [Pyrinomonadaceae bacterium]
MAAVDYFLKVDGIEGESQDHAHKNEIQLESWSWGESNQGDMAQGGGGGAGKVSMQDIHAVARISKASPKLMLACASGQHIKKAVLTCRKAGKTQQEFLKYTCSDLLVSSYQTGGSAHGDTLPMDQFSINFAKIELEYKEQKADGTLAGPVKAGWNLKENKAV